MASIFDILNFKGKGIGLGPVQSVDEMTVIPLVGDNRGDVAEPESLVFQKTSSYGSMVFKNEDDRPAIVPTNYMVRGTGAQDHAMVGSGIVLSKRTKTFNTACCIEETQGGYLSDKDNQVDVLPVELRRNLLSLTMRKEHHYGKLWPSIKTWLSGLGLNRSRAAHLRDFYDNSDIRKDLELFAAEFEPVDGQIGAIIMFSGTPVGLEIMPTTAHWDAYWKQLLRGCYGSELIRLKKLGQLAPSALVLPAIPKQASPDEVKTILNDFVRKLQEEIIPIVQGIDVKGDRSISKNGNLETRLITTNTGGGDAILQDSELIYFSLVL